jgi:hypothetical protein
MDWVSCTGDINLPHTPFPPARSPPQQNFPHMKKNIFSLMLLVIFNKIYYAIFKYISFRNVRSTFLLHVEIFKYNNLIVIYLIQVLQFFLFTGLGQEDQCSSWGLRL